MKTNISNILYFILACTIKLISIILNIIIKPFLNKNIKVDDNNEKRR